MTLTDTLRGMADATKGYWSVAPVTLAAECDTQLDLVAQGDRDGAEAFIARIAAWEVENERTWQARCVGIAQSYTPACDACGASEPAHDCDWSER